MKNPTTKPTGYVYIISCEGTSRIKIGYSGNPEKRLNELKTGAPGVLKIEYLWTAYQRDEARVHKEMAAHRRHLEWFDLDLMFARNEISQLLKMEPSNIIKPSDLTQIAPRITLQCRDVCLENSLQIVADIHTGITRIRQFPRTRTESWRALRLAEEILKRGELDAFDALKLSWGMIELSNHSDHYVSATATWIKDIAATLRRLLPNSSEERRRYGNAFEMD